ncbi:MAG: hypothetical protein LBG24_07145 [Treponema sp.]|jgi:hypothetical protein|nr:hypothetical protein [Treponema sp.]
MTRSIWEKTFVIAAIASGGSPGRISLRHILPHILPGMLVYGRLFLNGGGLSTEAWDYMSILPAPLFATACIIRSAVCFQMLGEALQEVTCTLERGCCLEREQADNPKPLEGVCEADETYFLERVKGLKIPCGYHRKARKHGAKAQKRGVSDEYGCGCAAGERDGAAFATAVNRAMPSREELLGVFGERVEGGTFLLCDGSKNDGVFSESGKWVTANASPETPGLTNINAVSAYHSFIKERDRNAGGICDEIPEPVQRAVFHRV